MILQGSYRTLDGEEIDLSRYLGKVVLVVNTASLCGFTKQYAMLEEMSREYGDRGLVVLGFPSGSFAEQELSSSEEIADFCEKNYGVTFTLFEKSDVLGGNPLFLALSEQSKEPSWNFNKYLIDHRGDFVTRFPSKHEQEELVEAIETLLEQREEGLGN